MKNYGFNPNIQGYQELLEIYRILEPYLKFENDIMIYPDNYKDLIGKRGCKLSKPFFRYANKVFRFGYSETEYAEWQKRHAELYKKKGYGVEKKAQGGIYCIKREGQIIYIGSTMRDFEKRFEEHRNHILKKDSKLHLYSLIDSLDGITFEPVFKIDEVKVEKEITREALEWMELSLITALKPIGNLSGVKCDFHFQK